MAWRVPSWLARLFRIQVLCLLTHVRHRPGDQSIHQWTEQNLRLLPLRYLACSHDLARGLSAHLQKQVAFASTKEFVMICNSFYLAAAVFWEPGLAQGGIQWSPPYCRSA